MRSALQETAAGDKQLARQKLTEMRLKKKRALKRRRGADDDGEPQVILGGSESE